MKIWNMDLDSPELIDKYQLSSKIQKGLTFVTVHKKNENEWAWRTH